MRIGERIRELREKRGIRQIDLAEALGVALTTVSGWENTDRTPKIDVVEKIAEYFGVTTGFLLGVEEDLSELESGFPEGVKLLRRANRELSDEQKDKLAKYIEFMINQNNN